MSERNKLGRFQAVDSPIVRFENKFIPEPNSGCWLWMGATNSDGYGWFWLDGHIKAARVAWVLYRGDLPNGLHVLHHCDNPPCVNPDHLFLGTSADNVADMVRKGRASRKTPGAKLTSEQVLSILHDSREYRTIAKQFNVSSPTICAIKRGKIWRSVIQGQALDSQRRLSIQDVQHIRERLSKGETGRTIAAYYGISESQISNIKHRRHWDHVP
jgi:uncharacterized protein YerC